MERFPMLKRDLLMACIFLKFILGLIDPSYLLAYETISVDQGGELVGTIKYKGSPLINKSNPVSNNTDFCGPVIEGETYLVNPENRGLKNVVISIKDIQRGKKPLITKIVIENRHCHFVPHVQVGMVGGTYEIRNLDPVLHNTHLHMKELTVVNVAMPPGGKNIKRPLLEAGMIDVRCDAHKFMQGWLPVMENPYFAVTDNDGNYKISDIPPGKYRVKVWHEGLPGTEKEVTISPDKKTELSLDLVH